MARNENGTGIRIDDDDDGNVNAEMERCRLRQLVKSRNRVGRKQSAKEQKAGYSRAKVGRKRGGEREVGDVGKRVEGGVQGWCKAGREEVMGMSRRTQEAAAAPVPQQLPVVVVAKLQCVQRPS